MRDWLGRTAALWGLFLMLLTSDHSVSQTWFSPNPISGNANVFFFSFWLISGIRGWKDWLGSHFFDAGRMEKIFPQLYPLLSLPPLSIHTATCHSVTGRSHESLERDKAEKIDYKGRETREGLKAWKRGRQKAESTFCLKNKHDIHEQGQIMPTQRKKSLSSFDLSSSYFSLFLKC